MTARNRTQFHPLTVAGVERITDDAVAITFDMPGELRELFDFTAGQHLTIRHHLDGQELRRTYSICAPQGHGLVRVAVKRLDGGAFSGYANGRLRPGDVLDVMPPLGSFHPRIHTAPPRPRHHVAIAAGSGITPVLSLLATILEREPHGSVTLVYGNRTAADIMFLEELEDIKNRYPQRFTLLNVLSREQQEAPLVSGRIDAAKLDALMDTVTPPGGVDEWYLCGPHGLIETAREALRTRRVEAERIHQELFHAGDEPPPPVRRAGARETAGAGNKSNVTFTLDGRTASVDVDPSAETVLTAVLRTRADVPYACRGGVCGTCRAKLTSGRIEMDRNYALETDERATGYVLTCQSRPATEQVTLDYDS